MRILQIHLKNLNSLSGEWLIDLNHPAYVSDGLFAITGPTGSGKSTILDAICLALYGRTPRLERVNKGANEIMSKGSVECFAEITFATQMGRFRCHWSQHRARRQANGELQAPRHEIVDADSGEVLESQLRVVATRIEAVTGMDFDRFTRAMLLAQGGFAAFLQASADKRAPILEEITGTGIYSDLSVHVHDITRQHRERLQVLQAESSGIQVLEEAEKRQYEERLQQAQAQEYKANQALAQTQNAIAWLEGIAALEEALQQLEIERKAWQADVEQFAPERVRLERARVAKGLAGVHAPLEMLRGQQVADEQTKIAAEAALTRLMEDAAPQAQVLHDARLRQTQVLAEMAAMQPVLAQVRLLDQRRLDHQQHLQQLQHELTLLQDRVREGENRQEVLQRQQQTNHASLAHLEAYALAHAADDWLVQGLAGVEAQIRVITGHAQALKAKAREMEETRQAVVDARCNLQTAQEALTAVQLALAAASGVCEEQEAALVALLGDRQLADYRREKDALLREQTLLARIAELEDHRARLEEGKSCPLCGATEHPYATGQVPDGDATEQRIVQVDALITQAEGLQAALQAARQQEAAQHLTLAEADKRVGMAQQMGQVAEEALQALTLTAADMQQGFEVMLAQLAEKLLPLGIAEVSPDALEDLHDSLQERQQVWLNHQSEKQRLTQQTQTCEADYRAVQTLLESLYQDQQQKQARLERDQAALADLHTERHTLFGERDPVEEECVLQAALLTAEADLHRVTEAHDRYREQVTAARIQVSTLDTTLEQRAVALQGAQQAFEEKCRAADFVSEADYLAACLDDAVLQELVARAEALEQRGVVIKERQGDRTSRLEEQRAKAVSTESMADLRARLATLDAERQAIADELGLCKHTLEANERALAGFAAKQQAIAAQQQLCRRWDNLHMLIGSADGKKFRNFAQGLTFDVVIAHANRQLRKMSDRYLLIRDVEQNLELNVIDAYQVGMVRSTKNLSGGEGFLVSLALALGLSQMSSQTIRVESLFLDEGFGTLDEEALDTALNTLASLQQSGKVIGVISHVASLKERIGTQIVVTPQTGGKSHLAGPGCQKVIR